MARKATVKKAAEAVDNTVKAAETTVKKAAAAVKKVEDVFVQYGEKEVKVAEVVEAAKAAFKEANGRKAIVDLYARSFNR